MGGGIYMGNRFEITKGDITKIAVDAIVNAANTTLLGGGGVDGAIHAAAGEKLLEECKKLNGCNTGEAKITAGYLLPAKHVIHTPGPIWQGGNRGEGELLKSCYLNSLKLAVAYGCRTVAFPSISTGVYRFPVDQAATIAIAAINGFLAENDDLEKVWMVCFDDDTKAAYERAWCKYVEKTSRND